MRTAFFVTCFFLVFALAPRLVRTAINDAADIRGWNALALIVLPVANAALGPNQGWNLDEQVTDGVQYARVSTGATTAGKIDPTKTGVLMKGSVAPTWSGAFTYVSTTASITWSWSSLTIARADGTTTVVANGSLAVSGLDRKSVV